MDHTPRYHHALVVIFIVFIRVAYDQSQILTDVGFSFFIVFIRVAWSITDSR